MEFMVLICMQVVKMESDILKFLNFEMGNPTTKTFLEYRLCF